MLLNQYGIFGTLLPSFTRRKNYIPWAALGTMVITIGASITVDKYERRIIREKWVQEAISILTRHQYVHNILGDWSTSHWITGHEVKLAPWTDIEFHYHETQTFAQVTFKIFGEKRNTLCVVRA